LIKLCVLNPDKRPHILPDQFVKERAWPTAPYQTTRCNLLSQARRVFYRSPFQCQPFFSFSVSARGAQTTLRQPLKKYDDESKRLL